LQATTILLDRDGVITEPVLDPHTGTYESPLHPEDVRLVPGAARAAAALLEQSAVLVVVSNQPAAAKGLVTLTELQAVHERAVELLAADGVVLDGWEYCYHHPAGTVPGLTRECDCRKPQPGLLRRALAARATPPELAWMVGDSDTDVTAGQLAGTRTALVEHPLTAHRRGERSDAPTPDLRIRDLPEFVELVPSGRKVA
jgi:D-glycero-D-manno-heptose 1,7-bisphosphate phosphatase